MQDESYGRLNLFGVTLGIIFCDALGDILRVLLYALCASHVQAPRRILRANRAATSDSETPSEFQIRDLPDKQTRKNFPKLHRFLCLMDAAATTGSRESETEHPLRG